MSSVEMERESSHLAEEFRELKEWQDRHTRVFCSDCRSEAVCNVRTIDGLNLRACDKHSKSWLGCKLTRRKVR